MLKAARKTSKGDEQSVSIKLFSRPFDKLYVNLFRLERKFLRVSTFSNNLWNSNGTIMYRSSQKYLAMVGI